jgi:hypothetical protein
MVVSQRLAGSGGVRGSLAGVGQMGELSCRLGGLVLHILGHRTYAEKMTYVSTLAYEASLECVRKSILTVGDSVVGSCGILKHCQLTCPLVAGHRKP